MDLLELPSASVLFIALFVASLRNYLRSRDELARAVLFVFAATTPVFVARLLDFFLGIELPAPVSAAFTLALLAQPLLTLRLAAMLHPVPRPVTVIALTSYLVTAVPLALWTVFLATPLPLALVLAAVGAYSATAIAGAIYFLLAARRRAASARVRLVIASGATLLMAGTLLLAGAASAVGSGSPILSLAARYGVVLAAVAYAAAFMAPAWLRRLWQARTGYELSRRLLSASTGADAAATWQLFADLAARAAGVRHAIVLVGDSERGARSVATVGDLATLELDGPRVATLLARADEAHQQRIETADALLRDLAGTAPVRFLTLVRFDAGQDGVGLLLLAGERRSLFSRDDRELFALLGVEAALLAGRARTMAEQAELAARLSLSVEALRDASRAKNDFLASMSHELRTPLNAILGFSDLMRGEPEADERRNVPASWIDHVHAAGRHLLDLINDVLDLAKIEAGRLELQLQDITASTAIAETLAELRPLAMQKQISLSADVADVSLVADRARFRQVLYNLVSNAIKFTPEGGSIRIESEVVGGDIHLSVIDTGVGIAPEDHERVFEEFIQVGDASARTAGTGLGLALTRRLVEAHGGRIELESTIGNGSRFTVVLPLTAAPLTTGTTGTRAGASTPATARARLADGQLDQERGILVIEDDARAVELVRSYLEPDGYHLIDAAEGVTGITMARRHRPAAILLDVNLPGMDGWEVLRRLKADDELRDIPVLMLTVVDEREVGLALGAVDYLLKPIPRDALLAAIRRHAPSGSTVSRPRVLAADDDPAALDFVRATLEPQGYEVVLAAGGREAIYAASDGGFDLIICDLVMPEVDGFEVVAQLKSAEATRRMPILILTAHSIDATDKARLNGQIVGICEKGNDTVAELRRWLNATAPRPTPGVEEVAA